MKSMKLSYRTTFIALAVLFVMYFSYDELLQWLGNDRIRFIHFIINLLIVIVSFAVTIQFWFSTKFNYARREIYLGSNYFLMSLLLIANFSVIDYSLKVPESNLFRIQLVAVIDSIIIVLLPFGMIVAHRSRHKLLTERHRIGVFIFPIVAATLLYGAAYYYFFVLDLQLTSEGHLAMKVAAALVGTVLHLMVLIELRKYYDQKTVKIYCIAVMYIYLHYIFFMFYQNIFDASYLLAYLAELMAIFVIFRGIYYLSVRAPYQKLAEKNEEIAHIAFFDEITQLPNAQHYKRYFKPFLKRDDEKKLLLLIELDRLELVRAALGTGVSELIPLELSERLKKIAPDHYYLALMNTNQLLFCVPFNNDVDFGHWCERVLQCVNEPFHIKKYLLQPQITIGGAMYPEHSEKTDMLLRFSNQALLEAHKNGVPYMLYEPQWNSVIVEQFELENDLIKALQNQEIYLLYQPQYSVKTKMIVGAEALVRWEHSTRGLISPEQFIPMLERSGMIAEVGEYVLRKACTDAKMWEWSVGRPLQIGVNLSLAQLLTSDYVQVVKTVLAETAFPPQNLKIEVTESTALNIEQVIPVLEQLRALGIKIAIDDFGTGYSSLAYLYEFPVDTLKVDRSFVVQIGQDVKGEKILSAIISMSNSLEFEIVAEGVEDKQQFIYLAKKGCTLFQGYLISPAISMQELVKSTNDLQHKMCKIL